METLIYLTGILPQVCTFYPDHIYTSIKVYIMKSHANSTAGVEPLPGRSAKRLRSRTPDSPLLNRSTRFKSALPGGTQIPYYEQEKYTTGEDLLAFLGDCVEFI